VSLILVDLLPDFLDIVLQLVQVLSELFNVLIEGEVVVFCLLKFIDELVDVVKLSGRLD
jgi:hypothetical protein